MGARRMRVVCAMLAVVCASCDVAEPPRADGEASPLRIAPQPITLVTAYDSAPALREVLLSGALVGRRVRVTGRCVGPRTRVLGEPPRPNPWQLEADGVAIYVIGARPRACSGGTYENLTVTALVAEDTLPAIGDLPPAPRRYLMQIGVELK